MCTVHTQFVYSAHTIYVHSAHTIYVYSAHTIFVYSACTIYVYSAPTIYVYSALTIYVYSARTIYVYSASTIYVYSAHTIYVYSAHNLCVQCTHYLRVQCTHNLCIVYPQFRSSRTFHISFTESHIATIYYEISIKIHVWIWIQFLCCQMLIWGSTDYMGKLSSSCSRLHYILRNVIYQTNTRIYCILNILCCIKISQLLNFHKTVSQLSHCV